MTNFAIAFLLLSIISIGMAIYYRSLVPLVAGVVSVYGFIMHII